MKIKLDRTRCDGFGICAEHAPAHFPLDDWGYAALAGDPTIADEDEPAVHRALLDCPVHAITTLPEHDRPPDEPTSPGSGYPTPIR